MNIFKEVATMAWPLVFTISISTVLGNKIVLDENYDPNMPPLPESGQPLTIHVSVGLTSILDIDEPKQMISLGINIRFNWTDPRATVEVPEVVNNTKSALEYLLLTGVDMCAKVWCPGSFKC